MDATPPGHLSGERRRHPGKKGAQRTTKIIRKVTKRDVAIFEAGSGGYRQPQTATVIPVFLLRKATNVAFVPRSFDAFPESSPALQSCRNLSPVPALFIPEIPARVQLRTYLLSPFILSFSSPYLHFLFFLWTFFTFLLRLEKIHAAGVNSDCAVSVIKLPFSPALPQTVQIPRPFQQQKNMMRAQTHKQYIKN